MGLYGSIKYIFGLIKDRSNDRSKDHSQDKITIYPTIPNFPVELKITSLNPLNQIIAATFFRNLLYTKVIGQDRYHELPYHIVMYDWNEHVACLVVQAFEAGLRIKFFKWGVLFNEDEVIDEAVEDTRIYVKMVARAFIMDRGIFERVSTTVVALGMLAKMAPKGFMALGFTEKGADMGTWAALWLAGFPIVETKNFYAYLSSVGVRWET